MRGAIYARESSDDTRKAPPVTAQIEAGKRWLASHGITLAEDQIYVDDGFSGGDWNRPDWTRSKRDARRHLFQMIWTWDQDRLARDTEQFLNYYRTMRDSHVRIFEHTANDWINMETLGGRVKHQSMAQAAEIFRLVTADKVKRKYQDKLAQAKKEGMAIAWGRAPTEFDLAEAVRLRSQGLGYRAIARALLAAGKVRPSKPGKEPSLSYQTVKRALQNRAIVSQPRQEPKPSSER